MKLRPYQEEIIEGAKNNIRRKIRSMLIRSPTGSGKTALTASMLSGAAEKGNASWFIVHRRELIKQSVETFNEMGVQVGVIGSGFPTDNSCKIQVCSIQTLSNRVKKITTPQLVIWDECHHAAAASWRKVREATPTSVHIGLTATPERPDGKGLKDLFETMVDGPSVLWLIEQGYLADYHLYNPNPPDMTGIKIERGDYEKAALAKLVDKPKITGDAIEHYLQYASGKRAIVFCVSIAHSQHVVEQFKEAGIKAVHVDGETSNEVRDEAIRAFEAGEIEVLSNCDLFGEGMDVPAIECVILLRPTDSLTLYLQQVGRGLRPIYEKGHDLDTQDGRRAAQQTGGKPYAIVLDHAGNSQRHGLPCEDREWSLEGRKGRKRKAGEGAQTRTKTCTGCWRANETWRKVCKHADCRAEFETQERNVAQVDGELHKVSLEQQRGREAALRAQKAIELEAATTYTELAAFAVKYKYNKPAFWVKKIMQGRAIKAEREKWDRDELAPFRR